MKTTRIFGLIALALAILFIATGISGALMNGAQGAFGQSLLDARARESAILARERAATKTAPSAVKKADAAKIAAETAVADCAEALKRATTLAQGAESGALGDEITDLLLSAAGRIREGSWPLAEISETLTDEAMKNAFEEAIRSISSANADLEAAATGMALSLFQAQAETAQKAVVNAETKLLTALEGIQSAMDGASLGGQTETVEKTPANAPDTAIECLARVNALYARAQALEKQAIDACALAARVQADAGSEMEKDALSLADRAILLIGGAFIGVVFTGVLLLLLALIALFLKDRFLRAWKRVPVFSTLIAAVVMIVIQTYALGFSFDTYSAWGGFWLTNMLNVLRSNSSVGMIALGMTFVIITGGIDLAVGSTLAGVATVVMVFLDVSSKGFLTGAGVTGMPNYLLAIAAGLLAGVGIGALTGLGITKGRVPPFIITLGVMNIVRSVAQYFTKSYKTEVPREFQALANTEVIGGQMLLPILYWLVLAIVMYVISRHTAFGRHIYAVGSNERTSRLSGINVNRVKMKVYMLMGFIVAIAAITQVARLRGVDVASAGSGYEMNAIAAVVVGGTSMAGGRGSILGTVFGVLIIGVMNNLLVLLGIDAFLSEAFTGAIIIFAVLMQRKDK